ncbi:MAG: nuclear transport factor 2 family protein [Gemmatimonadota bacterium]
MHANAQRIATFYDAFGRRDADAMVACYHPQVEFSDPVFGELRGARAGAMWRMLCARGKDLRVVARDVDADDRLGRAHWDAWYTFSGTGRQVHNAIDAEFEFRDGLILRHHDHFDLWRWSRQALGITGALLGWSSLVRGKIQRQATASLDRYIETERIAG